MSHFTKSPYLKRNPQKGIKKENMFEIRNKERGEHLPFIKGIIVDKRGFKEGLLDNCNRFFLSTDKLRVFNKNIRIGEGRGKQENRFFFQWPELFPNLSHRSLNIAKV